MFKFDELCELIRLVGSSDVAGVEIEHGGSRVRIEGRRQEASGAPLVAARPVADDPGPNAVFPAAQQPPAGPASAATEPGTGDVPEDEDEEGLHFVTSPIVGTFYRAPNPDADPYVKVGDFVDKGQVLCIVEAMKLMNEIESDVAGTIVKILPENAQPVEFGERLFAIRPS